jgi:hypothetical protein
MDMVEISVIEAPKEKFTWFAPLERVELNQEPIYFWYCDRMKVVPLISREMKYKYPDREYETVKDILGNVDLKQDLEYLKVWRNK